MFSTCKSICCKVLSYTGSCQHEFPRFGPKYFNHYLTSYYSISITFNNFKSYYET